MEQNKKYGPDPKKKIVKYLPR